MVWLKLSDDFADECARAGLSDAAFRTHVEALLWTMRRETGGHIDARDVRRFAESEHAAGAVRDLLDVGFWTPEADGWRLVQGMEHQPEPDVIEARRKSATERQRRSRRRQAGVDASRRDITRDETRDPGQGGSGRDRRQDEGGESRTHTSEDWRCKVCNERGHDLGFDLCATCAQPSLSLLDSGEREVAP